jgi:uncharacterized membrane protein (DUF106 family)
MDLTKILIIALLICAGIIYILVRTRPLTETEQTEKVKKQIEKLNKKADKAKQKRKKHEDKLRKKLGGQSASDRVATLLGRNTK